MDDSDPLERLLGELLDAHDRRQTADQPSSAPRNTSRRLRRRIVVVSAVVLAVSASAAAAIVIETRSSAPLSGALPHQLLGSRYMLRVAPDLRAGHVGWCVALLDIRTATSVLPNPTTCVSAAGTLLIARGGIETLSPTTGAVGGWLLYAVVDKRVAALKAPSGTRILPISSALLPSNWRAAVTIAASPSVGAGRSTVATLTPLDAEGRALATRVGKPLVLPTRKVDPQHPPASGCRIDVPRLPGVRVLGANTLSDALPESLPVGPGFLSCYSLTLDAHGQASDAALLVDAQHPGRRPADLPGAIPLRGHPGVDVESPVEQGNSGSSQTERLFCRRVGGAWLIVQTLAHTDAALALLKDLAAHA
jgi:hypothetical protein